MRQSVRAAAVCALSCPTTNVLLQLNCTWATIGILRQQQIVLVPYPHRSRLDRHETPAKCERAGREQIVHQIQLRPVPLLLLGGKVEREPPVNRKVLQRLREFFQDLSCGPPRRRAIEYRTLAAKHGTLVLYVDSTEPPAHSFSTHTACAAAHGPSDDFRGEGRLRACRSRHRHTPYRWSPDSPPPSSRPIFNGVRTSHRSACGHMVRRE
jgi:hypothetical protein